MVADAKRAQIDALAKREGTDFNRAKLFEEIGDIWRERIKDVTNATGAYLEGLKIAPASRVLLHKLLEAFTEQRQWRRSIETLDQLSALEESPERRARFHYTAAVIARDELQRQRARRRQVQRRARRHTADAEGVRRRREAAHRSQGLEEPRARVSPPAQARRRRRADREARSSCGRKLGDICADHLGDTEAATEAYQVACELAPDDIARHEQLADLYLEAGEARRTEAIQELQFLLVARARSRRALQGAREPVSRGARDRQGVLRRAGARLPRRRVDRRAAALREVPPAGLHAGTAPPDRGAVAEVDHPSA